MGFGFKPGNPFSFKKGYHSPTEIKPNQLIGDKNPIWKGGASPSLGYNWNEQKKRALLRSDNCCEITGIKENRLCVHHIIGIREFHKYFLKLIYPELYEIAESSTEFFGMFEHKVRNGHKDYKHFSGIPFNMIFPRCFYDELNNFDNLIVLSYSMHGRFEGMPIGFFDAIRKVNLQCQTIKVIETHIK